MKSALLVIFCSGVLACFFPSAGFSASPPGVDLPAPAVVLPRTGQILTYDQAGAVIDFAGSGQDGEFQRGAVWPDPRFSVNDDGTISDGLTGLMWLKAGNCFGDLPWPAALQSLSGFNRGESSCPGVKAKYDDWFLPDLTQLYSLVDAQAGELDKALRVVGFSEIQHGVYWSSTPHRNQQNVWSVNFANGSVAAVSKLERHFMLVARTAGSEKKKEGIEPSQSAPASAASPKANSSERFVDNGDGTISDTQTGMIWLQDASCLPVSDWQGALSVAKQLAGGGGAAVCPSLRGGGQGWSLPNVVEIRSLIDYGADYPALIPGHPFQRVLSTGYWTATTVAASPDHAFAADLETGAISAVQKTEHRRILLVRQGVPGREMPRKESERERGALSVDPRYVLAADPEMVSEIKWPPDDRFFNNGDGTSLDVITGINWLTDANCFGKKSWKKAFDAVARLNAQAAAASDAPAGKTQKTQGARRNEVKCEGYEGSADDWVMPTLAELLELVNAQEKDSAAWLNQQGFQHVQSSGIYWSGTETPLNLYFADAVTLKTGKSGNYPKSLEFNVWPHRRIQDGTEKAIEPLLNLTANTIGNSITVSSQEPLSLVVYLYTFGLRAPADFWFWYDTPDEKRLWLTPIRTWTEKAKPVYQGALFNLINHEIFRSAATGFPPGVYEFHFALDTVPNGLMDENRSEVMMSVVIPGTGK